MGSLFNPGGGARRQAKKASANIGFDRVSGADDFWGGGQWTRQGGLSLDSGALGPLQQALAGSISSQLGQGFGQTPQLQLPFGGYATPDQFMSPYMMQQGQFAQSQLGPVGFTGGSPNYPWQPQMQGGQEMAALQGFRGMQAGGPSGQFNQNNMFASQMAGPQQFGATPFGQQGQFQGPAFGNMFAGQMQNQFNPNQQALQNVQQQAVGTLGQSAEQLGGAQLDIMRQLSAQPEAQARQGLEQRLFSQGRLGTTGGGVQTQALNEAQSRADLERQLAAMQAGRDTRGQALQQLGLAGSEQRGGAGLIENLNQGMFGRNLAAQGQQFGQAAQGFGLNQQAQMDAFNRNLGVNQFNLGAQGQGFNQALQGYGANQAERAQQFQQQLAGSQFGQNELQNMFARNMGISQFGTNTGFQNQDQFQNALQNQFGREYTQAGANQSRVMDRFGIANQIFGSGMQGGGFGLDQFTAGLQQQLGLGGLQQNILPQLLGGLGQLQQLQLNPFDAALRAATAGSNSYANQAGSYTGIAQSTPNVLGDLVGGALGAAGVAGGFGNLFGMGKPAATSGSTYRSY